MNLRNWLVTAAMSLSIIALPTLTQAQAVPSWKVERWADKIDGAVHLVVSRPAAAPVRDVIGQVETPRLYFRCDRTPIKSEIKIFLGFNSRLFTSFESDRVRSRIDDGEVEEDSWGAGNSNTTMFWHTDISRLRGARALHVEWSPPLSTKLYLRFDLPGSTRAVDAIVSECEMTTPEPPK